MLRREEHHPVVRHTERASATWEWLTLAAENASEGDLIREPLKVTFPKRRDPVRHLEAHGCQFLPAFDDSISVSISVPAPCQSQNIGHPSGSVNIRAFCSILVHKVGFREG